MSQRLMESVVKLRAECAELRGALERIAALPAVRPTTGGDGSYARQIARDALDAIQRCGEGD